MSVVKREMAQSLDTIITSLVSCALLNNPSSELAARHDQAS